MGFNPITTKGLIKSTMWVGFVSVTNRRLQVFSGYSGFLLLQILSPNGKKLHWELSRKLFLGSLGLTVLFFIWKNVFCKTAACRSKPWIIYWNIIYIDMLICHFIKNFKSVFSYHKSEFSYLTFKNDVCQNISKQILFNVDLLYILYYSENSFISIMVNICMCTYKYVTIMF